MINVELHDTTVLIRLEGQFVAGFAEKTRSLIARCHFPLEVVVDLSEVNFVDAAGLEVLSWICLIGGEFIARSRYSLHLCKSLHLPLTGKFSQARYRKTSAAKGRLGEPAMGYAH